MKTTLGHLQLNVASRNLEFYRDLFTFLGWSTLFEAEGVAGYGSGEGPSLWFIGSDTPAANDYDGIGMNHLGISAPSQSDVDRTVEYLRERDVAALFETPRHRPEFAAGDDQTYYQVMFESPDRILFEVVYTGPKS